jgi:hypothetical protein
LSSFSLDGFRELVGRGVDVMAKEKRGALVVIPVGGRCPVGLTLGFILVDLDCDVWDDWEAERELSTSLRSPNGTFFFTIDEVFCEVEPLPDADALPVQRGMPETVRLVLIALPLDDGRTRTGVMMGSEMTLTMVT